MREYKLTESGLYLPKVKDIFAYIDDGGVSTADFIGFTILLVDEFTLREIDIKMKKLFDDEKDLTLHASDIQSRALRKYERVYRRVFQDLIQGLERSNNGYILSFLTPCGLIDSMSNNYGDLFGYLVNYLGNQNLDEKFKKLFAYVSIPILEMIKRSKIKCDSEVNLKIIIDRKGDFDKISNEKIFFYKELKEAKETIVPALNKYINHTYKNNCKISGLEVVPSENYPLLGIVDGISNFSFNYVKYVLKGGSGSSKTECMKYNVFSEFLEKINASDRVEHVNTITENLQFIGGKIVSLTNKPVSILQITYN